MITAKRPTRLKVKRIELGIKAYDVAAVLKISRAKYCMIENGIDKAEWWVKEQTAEALNVPYKELWGE